MIVCFSPPRSTTSALPSNETIVALVMTLPAWGPPIGNCDGFGAIPGEKRRTTTAVPSGLPVIATNAPGFRSSACPLPSIRTVALSATRTLRRPVAVETETTRPSTESTSPLTSGEAAAAGDGEAAGGLADAAAGDDAGAAGDDAGAAGAEGRGAAAGFAGLGGLGCCGRRWRRASAGGDHECARGQDGDERASRR